MANQYETGSYFIIVFDNHGTKVHKEYNIDCLIEAQVIAKYLVDNTNDSYIISRVIENSKDIRGKF